jgi:hypothetical protein
MAEENGWSEWRKLVLSELKDISERVSEIESNIPENVRFQTQVDAELAILKDKVKDLTNKLEAQGAEDVSHSNTKWVVVGTIVAAIVTVFGGIIAAIISANK